MAKKVTQYTKQRNRITSYIRKLEKQDLNVDIYFPTETELRGRGVKGVELSKLTRVLKKITPDYLRSIATQPKEDESFQIPEDNVLENGTSSVIVNNFKSDILNFPKEISDKIITLINTLISEQGIEDVAYSLQHMPMQFYEYIRRKGYDSDSSIQEFSSTLIEYLPNASDKYKTDLMDAFEYNELGYTIES